MGISNIDRAKSEGTDWITRAGSALREATVGDGRRHSDAVHPQTAQLASAINRNQSDPRTGAPVHLALARNGSAAQELPVSSASNVIAVTWAF